ncbi:MAG: ABC transporter permease [Bacillota bacterium]
MVVSGTASVLGALAGVPAGALLAFRPFRGRAFLARLTYTFMGFPPVLAGLVIYLLLSSQGPFGRARLLFTPAAMVIAQFVLVVPIVAGLTMAAVRERDRLVRDTALALGATRWQADLTVVGESRRAIGAAVMAAFGRAIAEVGAVMLVGGNIQGQTRVMTTAIVLETRQGDFAVAIALGLVLLGIAFAVNTLAGRFTPAVGGKFDDVA